MIGKSAQESVANLSNSSVSDSDFGGYKAASVYFSDQMKMSGTINVAGKDYTFTDAEVGFAFKYAPVSFNQDVVVDGSNSGNPRLFFDTEGMAYIYRNLFGGGTTSAVKLDDNLYVVASRPSVIPYAGSGDPLIEVYDLTFNNDDLGPADKLKLKVTVIKNPDGTFYAAGWRPLYADGYYNDNIPFEPLPLYNPYTEVSGDTYTFKSRGATTFSGSVMTINSFKLENHTGTLSYATKDEPEAKEYSYTAVKR